MKTIDLRRIVYLVFFVISFPLTEIGRYVYRPYIYSNNINDFGIADSMGNLGGIVVMIFFGLTIINSPWKKGYGLILFYILGYIVYEFAQPYLPRGTFDWLDIYGTVIGGIVAAIIYTIIHLTLSKKNKVYYKFK